MIMNRTHETQLDLIGRQHEMLSADYLSEQFMSSTREVVVSQGEVERGFFSPDRIRHFNSFAVRLWFGKSNHNCGS